MSAAANLSDPAPVIPAVVVPTSNAVMEIPIVDVVPSTGHLMHKNYLQQYAQRSRISVPSYSTINEGQPHVPRFRGTVLVDGMSFTSANTFSHRKEAEQDVAKLALEYISAKFKNEGSHFIHKDPVFCKLILNEYVAKMKINKPTYNTTQQRGILPFFITAASFDGKSYVGFPGKNKKEAEQNAACVIIDSILENTNYDNAMAQIIKTKGRLYAAVDHGIYNGNVARNGIETSSANDVNTGSELITVSNNVLTPASLPVGSTSWVPSTWVDAAHSNQVNNQIPSLGLPVPVIDSQPINQKKRNKRSKKKYGEEQSKRSRVEESSTSINPIKNEQEED